MVFDSSKGHHIQLHTNLHLCRLPTWFWEWPPLKIRKFCSVKTWDFVFTKTNQKLWFISRFTWVILNPQALQKCFCSQVRQLPEYDCCIHKICIPYRVWQQDCKLSLEGFCIWWAHVLLSFTQGSIGRSEGSHFFIKDKKCRLHETCKTVEWPHRLLRNPRDEPLRSCLNDVLVGAFMIVFLQNCF